MRVTCCFPFLFTKYEKKRIRQDNNWFEAWRSP
jgi:hypothetical protein